MEIATEQVLEFWTSVGVKPQKLENQYPLSLAKLKRRVRKKLPIIVEELEDLSSQTLAEYLDANGILTKEVEHQLEGKSQLAGALFAVADTAIVFLPKKQKPPSRKLFSLAHELGHYFIQVYRPFLDSGKQTYPLLVNRDPEGAPTRNTDGTLSADSFTEFKANQFAAELLMPRELVQRLHKTLRKKKTSVKRDVLVKKIVKNFSVSDAAAKIRILDLGLAVE